MIRRDIILSKRKYTMHILPSIRVGEVVGAAGDFIESNAVEKKRSTIQLNRRPLFGTIREVGAVVSEKNIVRQKKEWMIIRTSSKNWKRLWRSKKTRYEILQMRWSNISGGHVRYSRVEYTLRTTTVRGLV